MLSDRKVLEILNGRENRYTLAEAKIIKEYLENLCQLEYEILQKIRNAKDRDYLHEGLHR